AAQANTRTTTIVTESPIFGRRREGVVHEDGLDGGVDEEAAGLRPGQTAGTGVGIGCSSGVGGTGAAAQGIAASSDLGGCSEAGCSAVDGCCGPGASSVGV